MKAKQLQIYGVVQGVWFRASTKGEADRLGVVGWVKNMPDGSVLTLVQAEEDVLLQMVRWCQRGPMGARVDRVVQTAVDLDADLADFRVIY